MNSIRKLNTYYQWYKDMNLSYNYMVDVPALNSKEDYYYLYRYFQLVSFMRHVSKYIKSCIKLESKGNKSEERWDSLALKTTFKSILDIEEAIREQLLQGNIIEIEEKKMYVLIMQNDIKKGLKKLKYDIRSDAFSPILVLVNNHKEMRYTPRIILTDSIIKKSFKDKTTWSRYAKLSELQFLDLEYNK